ncbi:hypothetical protein L2E82_45581 [Cichorium intybus]|uniref:Uncharacterized protein n=1 Tax=Cichorium intybus TaxID=13427 RepID=A0ACB8ZTE2_CICIN|nr:hypothetical protein L2E82_45581 [Cichorium intybus]
MGPASPTNKTIISESYLSDNGHSENQQARSTLNPSASEWKPLRKSKMLFMTFSSGSAPISRFDVASFFTMKYGDCVDHVYINRSGRIGMEFGSIRFKSSIYPVLFLGKLEKKTEYIEGKTVVFWFHFLVGMDFELDPLKRCFFHNL